MGRPANPTTVRRGNQAPEYLPWKSMRDRCTNPNATGFENYGGRGIKVCVRWLASFENFLADMGPRPSADHSIDRIDNDGNYEPGNCRWATTAEQNQKKRGLVMLTVDGETAHLADWARRSGLEEDTLRRRVLKLGWDHDKAVKTPKGSVRGAGRPAAVDLTMDGVTRPLREWSAMLGLDYQTVYNRVFKLGWTHKAALTEPVVRGGRRRHAA